MLALQQIGGFKKLEILVDYLRFTSKIHSVGNLVEMLGLQDVDWEPGRARDGWSIHNYSCGMHIYFGQREDVGVELSGAGCRMLETCNHGSFDWIDLFEYIVEQGDDMNVSRLDIAGDDREDEILSMEKLVRYTETRRYISKARRCIWISGDEQEVMFGASSSSTRLRIYNKALERGLDDEHWIRAEFQLRDQAADSFILNLLAVKEIGRAYGGVLLNYLRYTTRPPQGLSDNYDRIPTVGWWAKFVSTSEKIKNIKVGGLEYNYFNLESFLVKQCASSLKAYVEANGGCIDGILQMIKDAKLSKKQKEMLSQLNVSQNKMAAAWIGVGQECG